jgi:Holliday junction resolvase
LTPEAKVKAKVKQVLKKIGAYYTMPATGGYGSSGAPDFIGCWHGIFFGIECKANGNTTTALQAKNLEQIEKSGGLALVVDNTNIDLVETVLTLSILAIMENRREQFKEGNQAEQGRQGPSATQSGSVCGQDR